MYNKHHHTPLILAVARGRTPVIKSLLEHGADVNSVDSDGDSCLHLAVIKHRKKQTLPDSDYLKKVIYILKYTYYSIVLFNKF